MHWRETLEGQCKSYDQGGWGPTQLTRAIKECLAELDGQRAEIERLRAELAEYVEEAFCQIAFRGEDGWWDTCALSTAMDLGDKLVEMGSWEIRSGGYGRRQFYRPIQTAAEAAKEE